MDEDLENNAIKFEAEYQNSYCYYNFFLLVGECDTALAITLILMLYKYLFFIIFYKFTEDHFIQQLYHSVANYYSSDLATEDNKIQINNSCIAYFTDEKMSKNFHSCTKILLKFALSTQKLKARFSFLPCKIFATFEIYMQKNK